MYEDVLKQRDSEQSESRIIGMHLPRIRTRRTDQPVQVDFRGASRPRAISLRQQRQIPCAKGQGRPPYDAYQHSQLDYIVGHDH